jgi:8-oxo-dGTP diphosphatase
LTHWTTLTGAGALVVDDRRMLLVQQRRPYGVHWEFPSGYYESGESFEQTAAREVLEETAVAVEIRDLLCTMVWERTNDRRRNVPAFFLAVPLDTGAKPRPQFEEDIDDAAFLDPRALHPGELHPLNQAVLDRWAADDPQPFHLQIDVSVNPDGTQSYAVRT